MNFNELPLLIFIQISVVALAIDSYEMSRIHITDKRITGLNENELKNLTFVSDMSYRYLHFHIVPIVSQPISCDIFLQKLWRISSNDILN